MPETFGESPFYNSLVSEVLQEPLSIVQRRLKEYNTTVNESIEKFNILLNDVGVDTFSLSEEYFARKVLKKGSITQKVC